MNRSLWRLASWLSRLLETGERDAVLGDLAEENATGFESLRAVAGLAARRQLAAWAEGRRLLLAGLVVASGVALVDVSVALSRTYELYIWIGQNYRYIDPAILEETGLTMRYGVFMSLCRSFLLVSWSWSAGLAMGSIADRRAVWPAALLPVPFWLSVFLMQRGYVSDFGVLSMTVLFLAPFLAGVWQGSRVAAIPRSLAVVAAVAVTVVTALAVWAGSWLQGGGWKVRQMALFILLGWPVWFAVFWAMARRREGAVCQWGGK